jgi:hypothetical protein
LGFYAVFFKFLLVTHLVVGALIDEGFQSPALFSCCELGSFDDAPNNLRILPVGPAPVRFFYSVSPSNSSTETPNIRAIGGTSPAGMSPASRS